MIDQASVPKILVVDDEKINIDLMVELLRDRYTVIVAIDGAGALELALREQPDIILLDVMMPLLDGYEVCTRLKKNIETMTIPVLFITANSGEDNESKGFACGAVDYIYKPISPPVVLARIETHLALSQKQYALESMVKKRTEQLEQSRKKAEEASEAKSAFLNNISHELRTPLNHIYGLATMLGELDTDPTRLELVSNIIDGATRLTSLFNRLISLSILEAGEFVPESIQFDLGTLLCRQKSLYRELAEARGLEFKVSVESDVPSLVMGGEQETSHILNNMFINALQYTKHGEIALNVSCVEHVSKTDGCTLLRFSVRDTGCGIPNEKLQNVFAGFEIGEDYLTKKLSGAGIGLTIANLLAQKMGGEIVVESTVGMGSTFSVNLPFRITYAPTHCV